jgi:hypothetical protein
MIFLQHSGRDGGRDYRHGRLRTLPIQYQGVYVGNVEGVKRRIANGYIKRGCQVCVVTLSLGIRLCRGSATFAAVVVLELAIRLYLDIPSHRMVSTWGGAFMHWC